MLQLKTVFEITAKIKSQESLPSFKNLDATDEDQTSKPGNPIFAQRLARRRRPCQQPKGARTIREGSEAKQLTVVSFEGERRRDDRQWTRRHNALGNSSASHLNNTAAIFDETKMSLARDAATSQVNTVPSGSNHGDSIGKSYAQVQRAESSEVDCKQLQEAEMVKSLDDKECEHGLRYKHNTLYGFDEKNNSLS
ncbi:hypothetical protein F441_18558 [Phytophthora nicotianae CJ01A1]|uniref:Uncharacterized protein n=1 Tax=Phytophthora nicotianae CJ01A1 TaxID=1317063 RepID=W2W2X0_PHYNI|nr:hypothetical protein F441_18558 [Phytophthora nicotianae CJ01A1]